MKNGRLLHELSESGLNIEIKLGDRLINQLLNSVIAKYLVLSVFRISDIFLVFQIRQIIDLLATDKPNTLLNFIQ